MDLDLSIEKELDEKTIEKLKEAAVSNTGQVIIEEKEEPHDVPAPKKSKKVRSEAQKAAFEKARKKRAEKVAERKKLKEEEKQQKKETRKIIKKKVKEEVEKEYHTEGEVDDFLIHRDEDQLQGSTLQAPPLGPKHDPSSPALVRQKSSAPKKASVSVQEREPVVNNYYYYGNMAQPFHPPPQYIEETEKKPSKKKKTRRPPTPSSSSDEEDYDAREPFPEPEPAPVYQQTTNPRMKFNYA